MDLIQYQDFATRLARESGEFIRPFFGQPGLQVDRKADRTVVTEADRGAERLMRSLIARHFPEHGILGEEYGPERPDAEFVWVLDPIDGTKSFVAGTPQFGTLIALLHRGQPVLGAIHHPVSGQLLLGDGVATRLNGVPVRFREPPPLAESILLTTDLGSPARHQSPEGWQNLVQAVGKLYTWGDCHAYFLAATGGADIACDPIMNPWDLLALIPVVRGAGGVITDWQGADPVRGRSIVAAHPALHAPVIRLLNP